MDVTIKSIYKTLYDVKATGLLHNTFDHLDDFIFDRNIAEERQSLSSLLINMSLYFF